MAKKKPVFTMLLVIGMVSLVGQLGRIKPGMYIGPKEPNKK